MKLSKHSLKVHNIVQPMWKIIKFLDSLKNEESNYNQTRAEMIVCENQCKVKTYLHCWCLLEIRLISI